MVVLGGAEAQCLGDHLVHTSMQQQQVEVETKMTYQIHSKLNGEVKACSLSELSRNCRAYSDIVELNDDGTVNNIWPFNRNADVTFAREFIEFAMNNYVKKEARAAPYAAGEGFPTDTTADDAYAAACLAEKSATSKFYASDYRPASAATWAAAGALYMSAGSNWPGVGAYISVFAALIAFFFSCNIFGWYAVANCIFMGAIMTFDNSKPMNHAAWEEFKSQHSHAESCAYATFKAATRSGSEAEYVRQGEFIVEYLRATAPADAAIWGC